MARKYKHNHEIAPDEILLDKANISQFNTQQFEGRMERPISHWSIISVGIFFFVICVFISSKLWTLQIKKGDYYLNKAENNRLNTEPFFANRGVVFDRNGVQLVWNREDTAPIERKTNKTNSSTDQVQLGQNGIPKREYIDKPGFAHLLGFVSYPKKDSAGNFYQSDYVGKDGIEKVYNDILAGTPGKKIVETNAQMEVVNQNIIEQGSGGNNVDLTIDSEVQAKLYQAVSSLAQRAGFRGGAGVIMDVHTGEILAITSYPEYNSNEVTNSMTTKTFNELRTRIDTPFINKAVQGLFTPGSTVKPYLALAALEEGIIKPETSILSTGSISLPNKYGGPATVFGDWKAHGWVNMREAIAASSDVYFYEIGGGYQNQKGLGIARIDEYLQKFGFTSKTNIDLPGEKSGVIPTPEWKKKYFGEDAIWGVGDTYHTSIGQYGTQTTPIELVRAVAALANGGTLLTPHVLKSDEKVFPSEKIEGLTDAHIQIIREGMRACVINPEHGTCKTLAVPGMTVAGKSGTAELGLKKDYVNSWMSGFFPYENPKYAFVILMERAPRSNTFGAALAMKEVFEWMVENNSPYIQP